MEATEECPQCGAGVPVVTRYVTWCECGWNLVPPPAASSRGAVDALYAYVGRRLGDRLAERLVAADRLEPELTAAKLAAYLVAVFVYLLTIGFAVGGVLLFALPEFPHPPAMLFGALAISIAFLMRPRFGALPESGILTRQEAPALYGLADEVADALGTRRVDVIAVDHLFNASLSTVGLRRRRVLTIGMPILAALDPQERVALIAHELAHSRNGDATRGLLVGSSVNGLVQLYMLIGPGQSDDILDAVVNGLLWVVSRPVLGLLLLQVHLGLRDTQRAEYLADALAADVAGTDAVVSLHEKLLLAGVVYEVAGRAVHVGRNERVDVFAEVVAAISAVPARERDRRRRVARLEATRLDTTHPPTAKRIELLERRPRKSARVTDDGSRSGAIDDELRRLRGPVQERLVDEFRDALYYG